MAAPRWLRETGWVVGGLLVALLLGVVALTVLTRTDWGRARVLAFTLGRLGAGIQGELVVNRLEGGLLTGARLYGLAIRSQDGEPFLVADSAYLDYSLRTLTTPRIHIEELVLYDPEVYVRRLPGDTLWNYEKIFAGPPEAEGPERITLVDRLQVVNGYARVQLPWDPEEEFPELSPREREREVALALSDTGQLVVERVPGGFLRTVEALDVDGRVSRVRFAPGTPAGTYLAVNRMNGVVRFFREPFRIRRLEGELAVQEERVEYRAPSFLLGGSPVSSYGVIVLGERGEDPLYDVVFRSDRVALEDLEWLYPHVPEDAVAELTLLVETRPDRESTLYWFRDAVLRAPGTRIAGEFGVIVNDTLRFVDVDLQADPLRVSTIEEMLPEGIPVEGLRIGAVEVKGRPASPRS